VAEGRAVGQAEVRKRLSPKLNGGKLGFSHDEAGVVSRGRRTLPSHVPPGGPAAQCQNVPALSWQGNVLKRRSLWRGARLYAADASVRSCGAKPRQPEQPALRMASAAVRHSSMSTYRANCELCRRAFDHGERLSLSGWPAGRFGSGGASDWVRQGRSVPGLGALTDALAR